MADRGIGAPQGNTRKAEMRKFVRPSQWYFWDAVDTPDQWKALSHVEPIKDSVAEVLVDLKHGNLFGQTLRRQYQAGYQCALVTKGLHQKEKMMYSFVTRRPEEVCHITVRLLKTADELSNDYKTVHIYVNQQGIVCGATLWDEKTNQPIS